MTTYAPPYDAPPDDNTLIVTEEEWRESATEALERLGITYQELERQSRERDFMSIDALTLWMAIGGIY